MYPGIQGLLADVNPCDRERASPDAYRKPNSSLETPAFRAEPLQPVSGGKADWRVVKGPQRVSDRVSFESAGPEGKQRSKAEKEGKFTGIFTLQV